MTDQLTSLGAGSASYQKHTEIDPGLLERHPRVLKRDKYNITGKEFVGYDVWNCYEFSTLDQNGFPIVGIVKITYPSDSKYIVESKSLKLYLNSFNMHKMEPQKQDSFYNYSPSYELAIQNKIKSDLTILLDTNVRVYLHTSKSSYSPKPPLDYSSFENIDFIGYDKKCDVYNETPSLLKGEEGTSHYNQYRFMSSLLRSNCPVTNQPDWGDVYIVLDTEYYIERESIAQYLVSLRDENHFHEEVCELIYKRLQDRYKADELLVACFYTRRGGIDINPVRATSRRKLITEVEGMLSSVLMAKSWRQ